jgi:hypothetical protein
VTGADRAAANGAPPAASLRDDVRAMFAERHWGYHERGDVPALITELSGPLEHWMLLVQVDEQSRLVAFYSVLPVTTPVEHRPAMAELLTRINYGLGLGCFELDFTDGEVRSKIVIPVGEAGLDPDLVERCIRVSGRLSQVYLPDIQAITTCD